MLNYEIWVCFPIFLFILNLELILALFCPGLFFDFKNISKLKQVDIHEADVSENICKNYYTKTWFPTT